MSIANWQTRAMRREAAENAASEREAERIRQSQDEFGTDNALLAEEVRLIGRQADDCDAEARQLRSDAAGVDDMELQAEWADRADAAEARATELRAHAALLLSDSA